MKLHLTSFLILLFATFSFAQENNTKNNSLQNQFNELYRKSSSYQTYKVISKEKYQKLKQNVLDSIKNAKKIILKKEELLITEKKETQKNKSELLKVKSELNTSLKKENSISIFGLALSKTNYNAILWGIILALIITLLYFIYKFSKSNFITKQAQHNLIEVEKEYEQHRKKSLEREQKLRRQLQDEINKQRNS